MEKIKIEKCVIQIYKVSKWEEKERSLPAISTVLLQKHRTNETSSHFHRGEK